MHLRNPLDPGAKRPILGGEMAKKRKTKGTSKPTNRRRRLRAKRRRQAKR
jgi:hypothetical protein